MQIKPGMCALINGGTFTVIGFSIYKEGLWTLSMNAKLIRKRKVIDIHIPEEKVIQGIKDYRTEVPVKDCAREESVQKDVARLRFLPRKW